MKHENLLGKENLLFWSLILICQPCVAFRYVILNKLGPLSADGPANLQ